MKTKSASLSMERPRAHSEQTVHIRRVIGVEPGRSILRRVGEPDVPAKVHTLYKGGKSLPYSNKRRRRCVRQREVGHGLKDERTARTQVHHLARYEMFMPSREAPPHYWCRARRVR